MKIAVQLVFNDWQDQNFNSVYQNEDGIELSKHNFHSGSTWHCDAEMTEAEIQEIQKAQEKGFRPVFELIPKESNPMSVYDNHIIPKKIRCPVCLGYSNPNWPCDPRDKIKCKFCKNSGQVNHLKMLDYFRQEKFKILKSLAEIEKQEQKILIESQEIL